DPMHVRSGRTREDDEEERDGETELAEAAAAVQADLDVAKVVAERDDYLDALRRLQADFENYKKRVMKHEADNLERASRSLAEKLLPVLDAFDGALAHGADDAKPIYGLLMDVLEREGLGVVYPAGEPFDPNLMEAVAREEGDGDGEAVVTEVLRTGYLWKGRVLRPAMVKVRG
ncbi:MAG: nucleotide exchange factor GrpE, partial [Acidimicrobiales bacterium]